MNHFSGRGASPNRISFPTFVNISSVYLDTSFSSWLVIPRGPGALSFLRFFMILFNSVAVIGAVIL